MERLRWTIVALFAASLAGTSAHAADPALIEAAKKEGEVVWYTTQIISQLVRPVTAGFEKKYGIKVRSIRANSTELSVRIINESRAGKPQSDVFDGTSTVVPLKKEADVLRWMPDAAKAYPAQYKDPEGYWVANNLFFLTPGFNTNLVPRAPNRAPIRRCSTRNGAGKWPGARRRRVRAVPASSAPCSPRWATRRAWPICASSRSRRWSTSVAPAREVLDQVIAGEYLLALQIFNHHAVISAKKGAPVDWIKMEPVTGTLSVISVHQHAPHPNAAKLLVDFIISREGQEIFRDAQYLPADPTVAALTPTLKPDAGKFRTQFFTPEQTEDHMVKWKKVYDDLFR